MQKNRNAWEDAFQRYMQRLLQCSIQNRYETGNWNLPEEQRAQNSGSTRVQPIVSVPPRWPNGKGVCLESVRSGVRFPLGDFSGSIHTSDLKIGNPVATLPGAWLHGISAGAGWPGVSIL